MDNYKFQKGDLDFISRLNGFGSLTHSQSNNLFGINLNLNGTPAPINQDSYGITFFTRPRLNLSYDNLFADRIFWPMQSEEKRSMAQALRALLDPVGDYPSIVVDPQQAFIPMLTNNLLNISGWPDVTVDTYTSKEGFYKEAYSMVDGSARIYNTYDVTANFRNIQGDPITLLFTAWVYYASLVYNGTMVPYPDAILENKIDYNTRIYRLVMNSSFTHVTKIAACGAAFPMASPLGASFNYNSESEFNRDNDQISIPFRCIGVNYMDPILITEFNSVVAIFNKQMKTKNRMRLVPNTNQTLLNILNHRLYPYIDPYTYELQWYAHASDFVEAERTLEQFG